jgi:hypothetical protein
MSTAKSLREDVAWLREHSAYMHSVREGYVAIVDDVESAAEATAEMEVLLEQAHELLTEEWQPTPEDRKKFLVRLERALP